MSVNVQIRVDQFFFFHIRFEILFIDSFKESEEVK